MSHSNDAWSEAQAAALEYTWGQYRVWAATARGQKKEISGWSLRVAVLTVAGAVLGTLSQQVADLISDSEPLPAVLGVLSGIAVALAAYFAREALRPERERRWVRSRSMAETLKSETYLFRAGVPPYDVPGDDAAKDLLELTKNYLEMVKDVRAVTLTPEQMRERLSEDALSVSEYIQERVDDQIRYYNERAQEYEKLVQRARTISLALGALAAILGVMSVSGWTAGWVAAITTITASIAAYLYSGRYQYLIVSYQATARQLRALKTQWEVWGKPEDDSDKRRQFIQGCEEAISVENNAWMSKWTEPGVS